jgi:hypothetical protein
MVFVVPLACCARTCGSRGKGSACALEGWLLPLRIHSANAMALAVAVHRPLCLLCLLCGCKLMHALGRGIHTGSSYHTVALVDH